MSLILITTLENVPFYGETCRAKIYRGMYNTGSVAIVANDADTGEPLITVSVNLSVPLSDGEFFVADKPVAKNIVKQLEEAGIVEFLGREMSYGYESKSKLYKMVKS